MGHTLPKAEPVARIFAVTDGRLTASSFAGSNVITVKRESDGVFAILKNLHKGNGVNVAWILLLDTIAGGLVTMSVTGILLWSRLHGTRLTALALITCSSLWAIAAALPGFKL
jgi:hypothetical protein